MTGSASRFGLLAVILLALGVAAVVELTARIVDEAPEPFPAVRSAVALDRLPLSGEIDGPVLIEGEQAKLLEGVTIRSSSGPCVIVRDSVDITIRNVTLGPCNGQGILIEHSDDIRLLNSTVSPRYVVPSCCDLGSGVFAVDSTAIVIDSTTFSFGETNIELHSVEGARITNNTLTDPLGPFPRGQQIQVSWRKGFDLSRDILIEGNTMTASPGQRDGMLVFQEDAVNISYAVNVIIRDNDIEGGRSASGCAVIAEHGSARVQVLANRVLNSGNCGIGLAGGSGHLVKGNEVYLDREIEKGGNVALYAWDQSGDCASVRFVDNIAVFKRTNGTFASYWDGGGCGSVGLEGNIFDGAAYDRLRRTFSLP